MAYVDGFVIPVKNSKRQVYEDAARAAAPLFLDHGALQVVENWGDDVPHGQTTDFFIAVKAEGDESVVFSWTVWPSKEARDKGNEAAMADPRFEPIMKSEPFDGKRMIFAGFSTILDQKA